MRKKTIEQRDGSKEEEEYKSQKAIRSAINNVFAGSKEAMREKGKGPGKNASQEDRDEFLKKIDAINQKLFDQDMPKDLLVPLESSHNCNYIERKMCMKCPPQKEK